MSKTQVETPVSFVQHKHLEVIKVEVGVLIQMLEEPSRGADQDVASTHSAPFKL